MSEETMERTEAYGYEGMDAGIRKIVAILKENGIETNQSCEGGEGHAYPEPTVNFGGGYEAGWRALALCFTYGVKVSELRWAWRIEDGHPTGPIWEMTFLRNQPELIDFTLEKNRREWLPKNWGIK